MKTQTMTPIPPPPASQPNLNVALLLKIKAKILKNPSHFRMDVYSCGTAACIAGWAVALTHKRIKGPKSLLKEIKSLFEDETNSVWTSIYAGDKLGLDSTFFRTDLFQAPYWPEPYSSNFKEAKTYKAKAQVAAARIDYLIARGL